jgi:hypothetical protein
LASLLCSSPFPPLRLAIFSPSPWHTGDPQAEGLEGEGCPNAAKDKGVGAGGKEQQQQQKSTAAAKKKKQAAAAAEKEGEEEREEEKEQVILLAWAQRVRDKKGGLWLGLRFHCAWLHCSADAQQLSHACCVTSQSLRALSALTTRPASE